MDEHETALQLYRLAHGKHPKRGGKSSGLVLLPGFPTKELEFEEWWLTDNKETLHDTSRVAKHLYFASIDCLLEGDAHDKAVRTLQTAHAWNTGLLSMSSTAVNGVTVPDEPNRNVESVRPQDAPRRGKGGTLENRIKMVHSLAHIESVAIDLGWDMVARFGFSTTASNVDAVMPKGFMSDWIRLAEDEARHYLMWEARLHSFGSHYGAMPTHSGLWDSATDTNDDVLARLAIEHMTLEGRGLDVAPKTFARFHSVGDQQSAKMLQAIYAEEVTHVGSGIKWFKQICRERHGLNTEEEFVDLFHVKVKQFFAGKLKPPFNVEARSKAGMTAAWYEPLSK